MSAPVLMKGKSMMDLHKGGIAKNDGDSDDENPRGGEDEAEVQESAWIDTIKNTDHANELFGLFAALGGSSGRSGNAMNRNPLPRGRACESADWLTEFFKYLPPTTGSCGVPTIRVPLTLTLRHSRPHTWYTSPKRGGVVEQVAVRQRAPRACAMCTCVLSRASLCLLARPRGHRWRATASRRRSRASSTRRRSSRPFSISRARYVHVHGPVCTVHVCTVHVFVCIVRVRVSVSVHAHPTDTHACAQSRGSDPHRRGVHLDGAILVEASAHQD